jgi:hypothetical protein
LRIEAWAARVPTYRKGPPWEPRRATIVDRLDLGPVASETLDPGSKALAVTNDEDPGQHEDQSGEDDEQSGEPDEHPR